MANLTIISWNVGGINDLHKRTSCLDILKRKKVDLAMLQETHIMIQDINSLENDYFKVVSNSSADNKTRGVSILVRRSLKFQNLGKGNDPDGRTAYLKTSISGVKMAFVVTYAPNTFCYCAPPFLSCSLGSANSHLSQALQPVGVASWVM